jgi:aminoglycoside/choline kinase family phosphotransferase
VERTGKIRAWLESLHPGKAFELALASADASFRRYFRASFEDGTTQVVMDAPPSHEDCRPWLHVQALFHGAGVHVPEVLASDLDQGFLLLSDLGSTTYLAAFNADNTVSLYRDAIDSLVCIQAASRANELPAYNRVLLQRELDLFPDWYIARHLKIELSDAQRHALGSVFEKILAVNLAEPQVYVHRDYHSRNLMVVDGRNPGIIDFQDAVYGPISYDLVSLFKDAYVEWPEDLVLDWAARYWEQARKAGLPVRADFADFYRDYEWMGVQRHIKVLGIFARLYHRDGKNSYLKDMPLVAKYLRAACERYRDLAPLLKLLDQLEGRQPQVGYTF